MQRLRNARPLGYKSRILVSLKVLTTKHHNRLAVKGRVRLGSIRNKDNWNNASKSLFKSYS